MSDTDTNPDVVDQVEPEPEQEPAADPPVIEAEPVDAEIADADLGELGGPLADTMWDAPDPPSVKRQSSTALDPVLEVPVSLVVELGRTRMTIGETLRIG